FDMLVGVSVVWDSSGIGYGDASFPDFSKASLRSISSRKASHIIYPIVAGELMIGVKGDVPEQDVREALGNAGLRNVEFFGSFVTAKCTPFQEPAICNRLQSSIPLIKYAEPNSIQRLVDIAPGWAAQRLI